MINSNQVATEGNAPIMIDCPRCGESINFHELMLSNADERRWVKGYVCEQCASELKKGKSTAA